MDDERQRLCRRISPVHAMVHPQERLFATLLGEFVFCGWFKRSDFAEAKANSGMFNASHPRLLRDQRNQFRRYSRSSRSDIHLSSAS